MVIQIHTGHKAAVGRRGLWVSLALLLAVTLLAITMTRSRAGRPETPRMRPGAWAISFQPPSGFNRFTERPTEYGHVYRFVSGDGLTIDAALEIHRLDWSSTNNLIELAYRFLAARTSSDAMRRVLLGSVPFVRTDKTLGPFEAVEIWEPRLNMIIRVTSMPGRGAYALVLVGNGPLDSAFYRRFEEACASVRPRDHVLDHP